MHTHTHTQKNGGACFQVYGNKLINNMVGRVVPSVKRLPHEYQI